MINLSLLIQNSLFFLRTNQKYSPMNTLLHTIKFSFFSCLFCIVASNANSQSFNATGALPLNLINATQNITSCSSNRTVTFTVSGVGILSPTNQLLEIDLRLRTNRRLYGSIFLAAPNGTCVQIANRMGDPGSYNAQNVLLDYKFRAPQPCLNKYPDYFPVSGQVYTVDTDSRSGVFSTVGDISTLFNGVNANGTWTMYFGRESSNEPPTVISAGLTFGEPIPVAPANPSAGLNCTNAIVWDGSPLCATTASHVNTQPTAPAATVSGCTWMSTSENNVWIAFTPSTADVCVNISGVNAVSGSATGVQSIIVSPTNAGTPCAGTWNVANCPQNDIYSSNVGSVMSSNHCFTAVPGQTYYLIVDGNAGAVTELYITGIDGLPVILAAELVYFDYECATDGIVFDWATASESHNDYFVIDYSEDAENWVEIGRKSGMGSSSSTTEYTYALKSRMKKGYYRLTQVDFDGKRNKLKTIAIYDCINENEIKVIPNPSKGIVHVLDIKEHDLASIKVVDLIGNQVYYTDVHPDLNILSIDLSHLPKGAYFIVSLGQSGTKTTNRILIE